MPFSAATVQKLQAVLKAAVNPDSGGVPGMTGVVFDRFGTELFVHSEGLRGASSTEPMSPEHILWVASCTKLLTALSVMQLVERGSLSLDDGAQLEALCPELADVQVLRDDGTLEPKRRQITLRMLLTHTAGFGYSFFNEKLRDYGHPVGIDETSGRIQDFIQPLMFHPGEGWQYGIGLDWAGIAVERCAKVSLNEYMHKHIFEPLGLKNISMIPTPEMKAKLAHMSRRHPGGEISPRDHLLRRALVLETAEEKAKYFNSGGAGLFTKPQDYCRVLAVLLNNGTCPTTGVRLLSASTVDDMFTNQIPQYPQFGRQGIPAANPDLTNAIPDLYPTKGNTPQGWGLACMLTGGPTGRSDNTGWWAGLSNIFWWVDRENGIGGMVCSQVLPFGDAAVMGAWFRLEAEVYAVLREGQST